MRSLALVLALGLALSSAVGASSGVDTGTDWEDTPLTSPTQHLWTPASGALLASTSDGLMRSDDAGESWYPVAQGHKVVYVDPSNQDTLYAASPSDILQRSTDSGATWTSLMAGSPFTGKVLDAVAASRVDPNLLYAGLKLPGISDEYWLYRSQDAGRTWSESFHAQNSLCGWGTELLLPHPSDPRRLIFAGGCHAGRDFFEIVRQSTDQGQTLTDWYAVREITADAATGFPKALIGGQGALPQRWYLALNRDPRFGGSVVVRSDDDGASWDTVLDYVGGGTFQQDPSAFSVTIAGIAYDPDSPDTVYVARNSAFAGSPSTLVTSGVTVSTDAGQSWNDLGTQQMGELADLALGIDGRWLFAASDRGVARLALQ